MLLRMDVVDCLMSSMVAYRFPFMVKWSLGNRKYSQGAKSGEYSEFSSNKNLIFILKYRLQAMHDVQVHYHAIIFNRLALDI